MEVILKQDVKHVGSKDEIVKVKNGYGRNFLLPKGLAFLATESAKKVLAENTRQQAHKAEKLRNDALKLAEWFNDKTIKIGAKAGENGKIYGSVTPLQLADAVKKLGLEIDRKAILMEDDHVKTIGAYSAKIKLAKDVFATLNFEVLEE
jgi:large subunit ribosomal protein L9